MKQFPIYIAAIAVVAAIGTPASQAADAQSGIIVAQATSPADANHPGSQPAFARQAQPEQSSAQQQPAQPVAQTPQQGGQPTAQSQQRRQSAPSAAARRTQPATTGSGSPQR